MIYIKVGFKRRLFTEEMFCRTPAGHFLLSLLSYLSTNAPESTKFFLSNSPEPLDKSRGIC